MHNMNSSIESIKIWSIKDPVRATILALGLAFCVLMANEVIGLLLGMAIVWWQREQIIAKLDPFLSQYPWWMMLVAPIVVLAFGFQSPPSATDDLLRHIVAYEYGYDYTKMMPNADLFKWSLWIGFDWFLGLFGKYGVRPEYVMWGVELSAFIAFTTVMCKAGCAVLPAEMSKSDKWYWKLSVFWLILPMVIGRIELARPEIFMSIWAISALITKNKWHVLIWAVIGVALSTSYWLAFLYLPAVLLLKPVDLNAKLSIALGLFFVHLVFWMVYSNGEYACALLWLQKIVSHETVIKTAETGSFSAALMSPVFLAGLCLGLVGYIEADKKTRCRVFLLGLTLLIFMATNQIRYIGIVAPLIGLFLLYVYNDKMPEKLSYQAKLLMFFIAIFGALYSVKGYARYCDAPEFRLPKNAKVMTSFSWGTYAVPFYNAKNHVEVAPSMAIASSDHQIQLMAKEMNNGKIDCGALKKYAFTHVVEQSLQLKDIPECLELESTKRAWRLWKVK